jgi:hypothetical protein
MCLRVNYKNKYEKIIFFASLKSLKKGVGSGVGSGTGSISQRCGFAGQGPHQNVTDPQHCNKNIFITGREQRFGNNSKRYLPTVTHKRKSYFQNKKGKLMPVKKSYLQNETKHRY